MFLVPAWNSMDLFSIIIFLRIKGIRKGLTNQIIYFTIFLNSQHRNRDWTMKADEKKEKLGKRNHCWLCQWFIQTPPRDQGAPARGRGKLPPPPETKKIVVEKWCYFPDLYNMTGPWRWDRKWIKIQFSIEIFICKFQNLLIKFQSPLVFSRNAQKFAARFLKFYLNY